MLTDLTVEITQRCENACAFCSSASTPDTAAQLPVHVVARLARDAASLGLRCISLSGGEPLLHPELGEILAAIDQAGLHTSIYTAGVIAGQPFTGWSCLLVDRVVYNAELLQDGSPALASLSAALRIGLLVEAHVVPMVDNLAGLCGAVKRLLDLGIKRVSVLRLVVQGRARPDQVPDEYELQAVLGALGRFGPAVRIGAPLRGEGCTARSRLVVCPDGSVYPCEALKGRREWRMGSVMDASLEQVRQRAVARIGTDMPCR